MILPESITTESQLNAMLTKPTDDLIAFMGCVEGDILILGVAGKMGVSLAQLAKRAIDAAGVTKRVIGVARFSNAESRQALEEDGIETIACDLSDPEALATIPLTKNVIYMAAKKFGTQGEEDITWVMNTLVPGYVARHFRHSNIVVFSTGCVYPLVNAQSGGSIETDKPNPIGDYATSAMGREMMFNYAARKWKTAICHFRLNYAIDLRYGVLHDIAQNIIADIPIDLGAGHFNCIWQGDANVQALLCLEHCNPIPEIFNITGPEIVSTEYVSTRLAHYMGKDVHFTGEPREVYLSNSAKATKVFGYPRVSLETLLQWQATWIKQGGRSLGKVTKFEVSDGQF